MMEGEANFECEGVQFGGRTVNTQLHDNAEMPGPLYDASSDPSSVREGNKIYLVFGMKITANFLVFLNIKSK